MSDARTPELQALHQRRVCKECGIPIPSPEKQARDAQAQLLRDTVIAGLRERGWPEPREQAPNALYRIPCRVWGSGENPSVFLSDDCLVGGYETADDKETGHIEFDDEGCSAPRIVEAIDRLRWVIGLPSWRYVSSDLLPDMLIGEEPREKLSTMAVECGVRAGRGYDKPPKVEFTTGPFRVGRIADNLVGLRGLPKKPAPKADPPYVPRKIGEF